MICDHLSIQHSIYSMVSVSFASREIEMLVLSRLSLKISPDSWFLYLSYTVQHLLKWYVSAFSSCTIVSKNQLLFILVISDTTKPNDRTQFSHLVSQEWNRFLCPLITQVSIARLEELKPLRKNLKHSKNFYRLEHVCYRFPDVNGSCWKDEMMERRRNNPSKLKWHVVMYDVSW